MTVPTIFQIESTIAAVLHPNFMVSSGHVSFPCMTKLTALLWQATMLSQGVMTGIHDLRDYDWEKNPMNIQSHRTDRLGAGIYG